MAIQTERAVEPVTSQATSIVGGDLGITRSLTLSNSEFFTPLNSFRGLEKKLKMLQKKFLRQVKGSAGPG